MSQRFGKGGRLKLSVKPKRRRGEQLAEWRKKRDAVLPISSSDDKDLEVSLAGSIQPLFNTTPNCSQGNIASKPDDSDESEDLPDLVIAKDDLKTGNKPPSNRFVCDLIYVIEQARKLEDHSTSCNFGGTYIFKKVQHIGLVAECTYMCSKVECRSTAILRSDRGDNLNKLAVVGALCTGSGFSLEEEKFAAMDVKYMSRPTYSKYEKSSGTYLEACLEENLLSAVEIEKSLAEARKDVDEEGYKCVSVIVDGGWCKRTYGHGYNSSSGVAVIIGVETSKILFVGIRNKLCLVCKAVENGKRGKKDHLCFKNWNGSSTAMESDIIVEGMKYLEEHHGIRCTRMIGDGDSNTMALIQKNLRFGKRVLKIECANHAVRRYRRTLERIQKNTSKFPGPLGVKCRKLLKSLIPRLVIAARSAIKKHAVSNHRTCGEKATKELISELENAPFHVFGHHEKCGKFCKRKEEKTDNYKTMVETGMLGSISEGVRKNLVSCANTLIWNATNNPAEHYMSQLSKTIGGKRIDHAKSGSINRRARIAAMAYQLPGQEWHRDAHKAVAGRSPKTPLRKFIQSRKKRYLYQVRRRTLFPRQKNVPKASVDAGGDSSYGVNPEQADLPEEAMKALGEAFVRSLETDIANLPQKTMGQSMNPEWKTEREKRLPSSFFKDVGSRRATTPCANLVRRMLYGGNIRAPAIEYGKRHESTARRAYEQLTGCSVIECGLWVDQANVFLCASPDGLVGDVGLMEIKCPYTAREAHTLNSDILKKVGIENNALKLSHKYYYQVQGQMNITKRNWCDFVVWCPNDIKVVRVPRNKDFWDTLVPKLKKFYFECVLPELINPRHPRKLPIREPN